MPKLTHPDAPKVVIDTRNPEPYISQGWVEEKPKSDSK